jgi:hypothetical protein
METTKVKQFEAISSILRSNETGIWTLEYKPGVEIDSDHIIEHNNLIKRVAGGEPILLLLDVRKGYSITPEARALAAVEETTSLKKASAILVDSLAAQLLANAFVNFNKPASPVKVFTSEEKAIEWLLSFKGLNE